MHPSFRLQAVYEKRGSLFFLSSKEAAQAHVQGMCLCCHA